MLTSTARVVSFAWKNLIRNAWIGLATVLVLVLALLSVNVLVGVNAVTSAAIKALEQKVDVSVYFKAGTPQGILDLARSYMASLPQTASVDLVSADEVLGQFIERHRSDEKILAALKEVEANPFGATMVVKADSTDHYPFLIEALKNPQFSFAIETQTYDDHAVAIGRVREIAQSVRTFGMVLTVIFIIFSILIVYNAIRVSIYTQREEIGIMRLVGASNAFVRLPLILNGVFLALISLAVVGGLMALSVVFLEPRLKAFFDGADPGLMSFFTLNAWRLGVIEGVALVILVSMSSWAAAGKYLKK